MPPGAERQCGQRRTKQGGGTQQADLPGAVAQSQQIGRQQDCDIAVNKGAQAASDEEQANLGRHAGSEGHFRPNKRPAIFSGVSAQKA
jgi:hypothetical protein